MNFAEKVKVLRKRYDMTLEELGKEIGVTKRSVIAYEAGTRPRKAMLNKLAYALGVTPELLSNDDLDLPKEEDLSESYVEEMRKKHGDKAASNLQNLYKQTALFFAGGSMPQEDKDKFFAAIAEAYEKTRDASQKKYGKVLDEEDDNE